MKKRSWLKACSLGLALVMAMSLGACSGKGNGGTSGNRGGESADASLAKQYVFASKPLDLNLDGDGTQVRNVRVVNDRINVIVEVYHWMTGGDTDRDVRWVSMTKDGEDIQAVALQFPKEDSVDGQDAVNDENEIAVSDEVTEVTDNEDADESLDGDDMAYIDDDFYYDDPGYSDDIYYQSFCIADNGYLYGVRNTSHSDWSDPENYVHESRYDICSWDADGNFLWERPIEGLQSNSDEYHDIRSIAAMDDGSIVLLIAGDMEYGKMEMDTDGNVSPLKSLPVGGEKLTNSNEALLDKGNGEFVITYYDDSWENMYLATYDIKTDTIKEESKLPASFAWSGYNNLAAGVSTDIVYSNNTGIWGLSAGQEEPVQIMSFINSDMTDTYFNFIVMLDDEHFISFFEEEGENGDYHTVGALFTKRNPEDIPDKKVLVLAANYVNSDVRRRVVQFNKSNEQYRIVTKEYESFASYDDYMAGYTQLNNDIISGNMPDILVYDENLPIENYVAKGLLADVGALVEKDEELSGKEYLENVFNSVKINDKLYILVPSFNVQTVIGKKAIFGNKDSWSFKDIQELVASRPEGTQTFGEMTKESFIQTMMNYCGSDFVDASTGKCNFDSQNFIDMLEFANTFPETVDYDYDDEAAWRRYWNDFQSQYRDERTLLMSAYIGALRDMNYSINGFFGEDVSYVGFPTENGNGSVIGVGSNAFVLSAKSANIDGAWEFVRYYLTDDYQEAMDWYLPVSKTAFMKMAEEATQKNYYIDENGEKVEYDDYFELNGENIVMEPLSQEQIDEMVNFIQGVDKRLFYNQDITNIINEETASYFAGQKSAADVAKVIQSRAQVYVDENR
ncbi:MAG: extracellular solute-binding protein [Lachnospiraceae bacterium]|nr:extracellular solute-binding protein [Lachnospiraceae bacterium]